MWILRKFRRGRKHEKLSTEGIRNLLLTTTSRIAPSLPLRKYDLVYRLDEVVMNLVNSTVEDITGLGFYFEPNEETDKHREIVKDFEIWSRKANLSKAIRELVFDTVLTGNGFQLIVYRKDMKDILGFHPIPADIPFVIDFLKDERNNVITDEFGRPLKYKLKGEDWEYQEVDREFIVHTALFVPPKNFYGVSLLEPIIKTSLIRLNLEDAIKEGVIREGYPFLIVYVGNESYPSPTGEELKRIEEELTKEVKEGQIRVGVMLPYWVRVERLESPKLTEINEVLRYFSALEHLPFRIPTYEVGGRGSLEVLRSDYERHIQCLQNILSEQIQEQIIDRRGRCLGLSEDYIPRFRFIPLSSTIRLSKARRIATYMRYNAITPDIGLENAIRREEGLPIRTSEQNIQERKETKKEELLG